MKIGLYEADVTPPLGRFLPGYNSRRYGKDVFDHLYTKAAVFEEDGNVGAILVLDACTMTNEIADKIKSRIFEFTGIKPENVCVSCNHTHYGAPIAGSPFLGEPRDESYTDVFLRVAADAVTLAYNRREEATLSFGTATVDGISYCRVAELDNGTIITFPRGRTNIKRPLAEPDNEIGVLFIERDGKKIGAISNYSLHQDTTEFDGYSGDFSSEMSNVLKEKYGHDFVSIFALGCCGDINHVPYDINEEVPRHRFIGQKVVGGVLEAAEKTSAVADTGVDTSFDTIEVKLRKYTEEDYKKRAIDLLQNYEGIHWRLDRLLGHRSALLPETGTLRVQVMRIGEVGIYMLPGEPFVDYCRQIKEASPYKYTMVMEFSNGVGGYFPTLPCFGENSDIYEASPSTYSNFEPNTGNMLVEKALELGKKIYK